MNRSTAPATRTVEERRKARIIDLPDQTRARAARQQQNTALGRVCSFLVTGMILFMLCATLYTRSEIARLNDQIGEIKRRSEALRNDEVRLNMELESRISYTNIEQAAKEMGMKKKDYRQVIYLQLEENDRVIVHETPETYVAMTK